MEYQFIIKKGESKTSPIILKGAWIECHDTDDAWDRFYTFMAENPQYSGVAKLNKREKPVGRGGKRPGTGGKQIGAGRPKGSGKWGDQETTIARIPAVAAAKIEELIESQKQLDGILQAWKAQCESAKNDSSTGKFPRTYDKVLQLIKELDEEVNKLPFII